MATGYIPSGGCDTVIEDIPVKLPPDGGEQGVRASASVTIKEKKENLQI